MHKYKIDYGYGVADFYTEAVDPAQVRREFHACANECFGIRKSLDGYQVQETYRDVALPLPYRNHLATHFLSHHGDEILFDRTHSTPCGAGWKLHNESGEWCSCRERGVPELACEVHHFWVANHDQLCRCSAPPAADPRVPLVGRG